MPPSDPLDQMRQDNRSIESEARRRSWQEGRRVDQFGFVDRRTFGEAIEETTDKESKQ